MSYSFYGGEKGSSFAIVRSFRYISQNKISNSDKSNFVSKEYGTNKKYSTESEWINDNCMKESFQTTNSFNGVGYDEYVIIDSFDKNDSDNGKIYRRGYDNTGELGGAQYIGQIVGPSGTSPNVEFKPFSEIDNITIPNNYYAQSSSSYTLGVNDLVPGKVGNTYNDSIIVKSRLIKDDNEKTVSYIGLKIPYPVINFNKVDIDPYNADGSMNTNAFTIEKVNNGNHPFYQEFNMKIPSITKLNTICEENTSNTQPIANKLMTGGIWFVVSGSEDS